MEESKKEGKCTPCRSKTGNVCCKQVKTATTFKSKQTNKTWKIFHSTNSKTICHLSYRVLDMQPTVTLRECLIQKENFWIQKLETLTKRTKSRA